MNLGYRRLSVLIYCVLIFILSSQSHFPSLQTPKGTDKIIHFMEYGILAFLFYQMALREKISALQTHPFLQTSIFVGWYSLSDEIHQHFVPHRTCSLTDWFADILGAWIVLGLLMLTRSKQEIETESLMDKPSLNSKQN